MISFVKTFLLKKIYKTVYKPGHYYSTIPSSVDLSNLNAYDEDLPGIDLNKENQIALLNQYLLYKESFPYQNEQNNNLRYNPHNNFFILSDAFYLHSILRTFKPKNVIEVGSGYSSALMLDTNELFLNHTIQFTFIDPYPERLKSLLREKDFSPVIKSKKVQEVNLDVFESLEKGDLLFIDSSHVSKAGSDLNYLLFKVIPRLKSGVIVHFHDILFPFEYPKEWFNMGIFWNECYLLHSFLMYNQQFEILLFNDYLTKNHSSWIKQNLPIVENGGGSIYLRKL